MELDREIGSFVANFRGPVCFLLGLPEKNCSDRDLVIFVDYLAGHRKAKHLDDKQKLGVGFLRELKEIPREKRTSMVLKKISEYFDRSNITKNALTIGFDRSIPFSNEFSDHLNKWRAEQLRKNFRQLHNSVNKLNASVVLMISLLESKSSSKIELALAARNIRSSIQSCEFHLKSGVAMSVVNNIHPQNIWRASHRLYLNRADRMTKLFEKLDVSLRSKGVNSNLAAVMVNRQHRWRDGWRELFENHRTFRKTVNAAEERQFG